MANHMRIPITTMIHRLANQRWEESISFRIWKPEEFTQNNGKLPPAPKFVGEVQIQKPFHQGGFKKHVKHFLEIFQKIGLKVCV